MKKLSKRFKAGLSLVLVCGMILGNVISANAAVDNRVDECILKEERVDSSAKEFNNDEESGNTDSKAMLDAADAANEAASNAAVEVGKLTDAIDELKLDTKIEDAVSASNSAVTTANGAVAAANAATSAAASASGSAAAALDAKEKYDAQFALDLEAIDSINLATVAAIETVASEAAIEAQSQADRAKELMDIALTGNAKDDKVKVDGKEKTVVQVVEMIGEAADAAKTAYKNASTAAVKAESDLAAAIKDYNRYAVTYGEPLYGEEEVTYLKDGNLVFDGLGFTDDERKAILTQRERAQSFDNNRKEALNQEITDCSASVENAKETVQAAKDAADDAQELFDAAKEKIEGYVEKEKADSHEAIERVADRTADEAKAAREAYEKKEGADKAPITSTNLDDTKKEIEQNNKNIAEQKKNKKDADSIIAEGNSYQDWIGISAGLFSGCSFIEACRVLDEEGEGFMWEGFNSHINTKEEVEYAREFIKKYDKALEDSKAAQALIDLYTEKGKALDKKEIAETEAAKADSRVAIIKNREKTLKDIVELLADDSDKINQVEYDKALNAWANSVVLRYKDQPVSEWLDIHDDAITTRVWMDNLSPYTTEAENFVEEILDELENIFNTLGLTQWAVSKEKREARMDEIIAALRDGLAEDEKLLAAAEALEADSLANTATVSKAAIESSIQVASQTAIAADEAVKEADAQITAAKNTIATAKQDLAAAKAAVSDAAISYAAISAAKLDELEAKIAAAEKAVKTAEKELEFAETAKKVAEGYKFWANELIKDHYAYSYVDNKKNSIDHGETFDGKTQKRWSQEIYITGTEKGFDIDYLTYRNLVKKIVSIPDVSANIYEDKYKNVAVVNEKPEDTNVTVIYFELAEESRYDKDGNPTPFFTGKTYTKDQLPNKDAKYFVAYSFKHTSSGRYHLDGTIVEVKYVAPQTNNDNNNGGNTPSNYTPSNIVTNNETLDLKDNDTPEGVAAIEEKVDKTPVITVNDDVDETPQGAIPNTLKLGEDDVAQGALPQTGTVPVSAFYFAAVMLLLAAVITKRSFAK